MKNSLYMAIMILASLLFVASGASAQYCSTFLPSCHWQQSAGWKAFQAKELKATPAGEQQAYGEFVPTVGAIQQEEQMTAAGAGRVTGEKDVRENAVQFTNGRGLCGYCNVFERAGFP
jgi:hypothetical protein